MDTLLRLVFFGVVVLLATLAFVPYKECFMISTSDFPNMMETCLENIRSDALYNTVTSNEKYLKVAAMLDKALTHDTNNNVVTYQEKGSDMCIMSPRKFSIPNSCVINGKNGVYRLKQVPANSDIQPSGCLIDPNQPNFTTFLGDVEYLVNKNDYEYIASVQTSTEKSRNEAKALESKIEAERRQTEATKQKIAELESENNILQSNLQSFAEKKKQMSQMKDGMSPERSIQTTAELKRLNVATNGIRWVMCDGQPRRTFCLMDHGYDGGGWMLLAKMDEGNTFHYDSNHWEQPTVLNPDDLTILPKVGGRIGDAKFPAFNSVPVKDIMVIFLIDVIGGHLPANRQTTEGARGWVWIFKDWWPHDRAKGTTALTGFNKHHARDAPIADPLAFDREGLERGLWSHQSMAMRVVIGGHRHLVPRDRVNAWNWGTLRLGITCNENGPGDFMTTDTWAGLGGGYSFEQCTSSPDSGNMPGCFSAGDYFGCCGVPGQRRRFKALLFGR